MVIVFFIISTVYNSFNKNERIEQENHSVEQLRFMYQSVSDSWRNDLLIRLRTFIYNKGGEPLRSDKMDLVKWEHNLVGIMNSLNSTFGLKSISIYNQNKERISLYPSLSNIDKSAASLIVSKTIQSDQRQFKFNGADRDFYISFQIDKGNEKEVLYVLITLESDKLITLFSKLYGSESKLVNKMFLKKSEKDIFIQNNKVFLRRFAKLDSNIYPNSFLLQSNIDITKLSNSIEEKNKDKMLIFLVAIVLSILSLILILKYFLSPIGKILNIISLAEKDEYHSDIDFTGHSELHKIGYEVKRMVSLIGENIEEKAELLKSRTSYFSSMSHDLRTPLNGIKGAVQLLKDSKNLNEDEEDLIKAIGLSSNTLLEIINDILDISKLEAGKMELDIKPFSVKSLFEEVTAVSSLLIKQKENIKFKSEYDFKNISYLRGDILRIKQVIINLLSNAIKFTEEGCVSIKISINRIENSPIVILETEITDTGIGMDQKTIECIFDDYSQGTSGIYQKFQGTGLGLGVVKRLVKLMDGDVQVSSVKNEGASFKCSMYLGVSTEAEFTPSVIEESSKDFSKKYPLRIHIAEDNLINTEIAIGFMKKLGYAVSVSKNGEEVLKFLENEKVDLIFMDCHMPVMDGYNTTKAIKARAEFQNITVVALTANNMPEDQKKCFDSGMDDFLTKPISLSQLQSILKKIYDMNKKNVA